jgi:hypothetical protein
VSGITTINNSLYIGQNDSYPNLRLGSVNGNNLGIATNVTGFLNSSAAGDVDLWHHSAEGLHRLYFGSSSGASYLAGGNTDSGGICTEFMSGPVSGYKNLMSIYNNGTITFNDGLSVGGF